ncbi:hypothetical protein J6590_086663 [Homalodisca vitripennis]|nr:hypothetical protein J6590_086663 [Homalodisca vitripennis]
MLVTKNWGVAERCGGEDQDVPVWATAGAAGVGQKQHFEVTTTEGVGNRSAQLYPGRISLFGGGLHSHPASVSVIEVAVVQYPRKHVSSCPLPLQPPAWHGVLENAASILARELTSG